jgi:hypothetical protein
MPKHSAHASCRLTAFGDAVLTFPYSARLVDDLKQAIPYRFRTYDPRSKTWTIEPAYVDLAIATLLEHYPDAEVPRRARTHCPAGSWWADNDHFRILPLRETAPVELIESAYRVLARLNHPDAGGTDEATRAINGAYAALRERVSA